MPRRDHQDAALAKKSGALLRVNRDTAELRASDVGDSVVLRELIIHECVVRSPDLEGIAIVAQLAQKEQFRFASKRLA